MPESTTLDNVVIFEQPLNEHLRICLRSGTTYLTAP